MVRAADGRVIAAVRTRFVLLAPLLLLAACSPSLHDLAGGADDVERLSERLEANPDRVDARNDMDKTPLHYAVTYGREEAVALLIERGADVNAKDVTGMTPLHCAMTLDRLDEAELLVKAGADVEARDAFGDTPLHAAALHGRTRSIHWLHRQGANLDAENGEGHTPLDLAVREHNEDAAERLESLMGR